MRQDNYEITADDGTLLRGTSWIPENPERVLLIVHGLGEHIGRYQHVADYFNARNTAVLGTDARGHGKSDGKRGHALNYDVLMADVCRSVVHARDMFPHIPIITYGHSMGGNLVANYILRGDTKPLAAAIISSGWFKLAFEPPAFKVSLGKFMSGIYPAFTQDNELDANDLSRDPAVVKAYEEDPLVHSKISASLFLNVYEAGYWALDNASKLNIPVLVTHGSIDKLTSAAASKDFAEQAGPNATFQMWEGMPHEPHNDPEKEKVLECWNSWILQQTAESNIEEPADA